MGEEHAGAAPQSTLVARLLGPGVFLLILLMPTPGLEGPAKLVAGVTLWMAAWWVTEAVPLAASSLLLQVLFPLFGVQSVQRVAENYGKDMVFLFLGGFVLALAVERSDLHRRIALKALNLAGNSPKRQVWGFLAVTAALSMWLSNMAAPAAALHEPAYLLMVPATVAWSCAFMLPVATPPKAIAMGSGYVTAKELFTEGFRLNLISAVVITVLVLTWGRVVLPLG